MRAGIVPNVKIFQHVSIVPEGMQSIDLKIYKICEVKDVAIKKIERLIKEASFDCALFYDRNYDAKAEDFSRACEYQKCKYKCAGISNDNDPVIIDESTFNLYYSDKTQEILNIFQDLFKADFAYEIKNVIDATQEYNLYQLFTAIKNIISQNIIIKNKYGFDSYLRENNNILFLVDSISDNSNYSIYLYSKYPVILDTMVYETALADMRLEDISKCKTIDQFKFSMQNLPEPYQKLLIQTALIEDENDESIITQFIKKLYSTTSDKYQYTLNNIKYTLVDGEWEGEEIHDIHQKIESDYNYAGVRNPESDQFCIRKKSKKSTSDSRLIRPGMQCYPSWPKKDLILVAENLGLSDYENDKNDVLCGKIRSFFEQNNLMELSRFCGVAGGKKKG